MKLNRKLWTAALAVAMTTPSAMAAQDTAGMHYTSAAEGFYASIRLRYVSNGGDKDGAADIQNSSSRFGVRGTNDLGAGLEGFYQYEAGVETENSGGLSTRVGVVGLRGDFGEVAAGSFWTNSYNWVYGSTDIANRHSGAFAYGDLGQGRSKNSIQYSTPNLNGFQAAILVQADSSRDGQGSLSDPTDRLLITETEIVSTVSAHGNPSSLIGQTVRVRTFAVSGEPGGDPEDEIRWVTVDQLPRPVAPYRSSDDLMRPYKGSNVVVDVLFEVDTKRDPGNPKDDNDIDHWNISAKYDVAGFSTGISFSRSADSLKGANDGRKDGDQWAAKMGYAQDNWYVNAWYGEADANHGLSDVEIASIAGGVSVDKVDVYAVYETKESGKMMGDAEKRMDDSYTTLGVQYTLGSNSWTWVEYAGRDKDSSTSEDSDFSIGLGHSF